MSEGHIADSIYVYVERFDQASNTVLVDPVESNTYNLFLDIIRAVAPNKGISDPSMILIKNYHQKKLREGTTYEMDQKVLASLVALGQVNIFQIQGDSLIIGYQIDLSNIKDPLFLKSKSFSFEERFYLNLDFRTKNDPKKIEVDLNEPVSVTIRNVGQGSWNEIRINNRLALVFDIGTHYFTSKEDVKAIIGKRETTFQEHKPNVVISHWDVDHYHCLKGMSDETLSSIQYFLCRSYLPTMTSRMIFVRIQRLIGQENMFPLAPFEKPEKSLGYAPLIKLNDDAQNLIFYNSCEHRNRNQNAICMAIRRPNSSIVLPADVHYKQISNCILPDLGFENDHYLVVPHHGGNAGSFLYDLQGKAKPTQAIISVGKNSYGHPIDRNIDRLRKTGFRVLQTRFLGKDVDIDLS